MSPYNPLMPESRTLECPPEIRRLPPLVAAQIAAGEVIDRPASVVKELIDNALDAGATRITVEIEQGGVELVRVSDNGCGIPAGQLPLAVAEHCTSKIRDAADLDRITTLGFRGEALASIASVSRLVLRSRSAGEESASAIEVEGDRVGPVRPDAGPPGTTVIARNLFFNTPARRKFLRTPATEQGRCADVAAELAMSHPAVAFTLIADGRTLFDLPPGQQPRDRVLALLGREMESQYLEAEADQFDDARGAAMWGLVGTPALARPTTKWQHLFLNGRPIRDKTIQHALKEAYRGLIEPGSHPAAVLMIEMDPGAVDVNVHPAKAEVRFRDSGVVHSLVLRAVREALRSADLTPTAAIGPPASAAASRFVDYFKRVAPAAPESRFSYEQMKAVAEASHQHAEPPAPDFPRPMPAPRVLQVHNSYLVTQDEQGVVIIDQHALHERVMFEKLKERVEAGTLESQRLLVPAIVSVADAGMEALELLRPMLARLGVEAEAIGPRSIAVHAFPSFLFDRGVDASAFLGDLLDRAQAEHWSLADTTPEAVLHEVLDMMACKAAVKAGEALSEEELSELIAMRERVERPGTCPHGRPTTLRVTIGDLEKLFGRT